jgi:DNA modification methylase
MNTLKETVDYKTGVACKNLNRNYIFIEKEQEYIDIINKRLNKYN